MRKPSAGAIDDEEIVAGWPHAAVRRLAVRQRNLVTHEQLRSLGISEQMIARRLKSGALIAVHRGVYALGALELLPGFALEHAAILACGPDAVLSHESAAALWGLALPKARRDEVVVTVVRRGGCHSRPGLRLHRVAGLDRRDVRRQQGLPVTAPALTLLNLAATLGERQLERAFDEALVRGLMRRSEVLAMLERHPRRRGVGRLRALVGGERATTMTRSEAEERFLALVRRAGLPAPEVNARWEQFEIDFLWRAERVAVEIDGHDFHSTRHALERDHGRDAVLQVAGVIVLRFSGRELRRRPEALLVRVVAAMARQAGGAVVALA